MLINPNPFPHLEQIQFAGLGNGEIVFLDKTIPEAKKEWLRQEYRKWWEEQQQERLLSDRI